MCGARINTLPLLARSLCSALGLCLLRPRLRLASVELHASSTTALSSLSGPPPLAAIYIYSVPLASAACMELPPGRDKASFAGVRCGGGLAC